MSHESLFLFFSFLLLFFVCFFRKEEGWVGGYNEEDASREDAQNIPRNESVAKSFVYIISLSEHFGIFFPSERHAHLLILFKNSPADGLASFYITPRRDKLVLNRSRSRARWRLYRAPRRSKIHSRRPGILRGRAGKWSSEMGGIRHHHHHHFCFPPILPSSSIYACVCVE